MPPSVLRTGGATLRWDGSDLEHVSRHGTSVVLVLSAVVCPSAAASGETPAASWRETVRVAVDGGEAQGDLLALPLRLRAGRLACGRGRLDGGVPLPFSDAGPVELDLSGEGSGRVVVVGGRLQVAPGGDARPLEAAAPGPRGTVLLLCGPSFAGKSTLARRLAAALDAATVALDEINARRGLAGGFSIPVAEWSRTHELAKAELEAHLSAGRRCVVVDDTNRLRFLRDGYRAVASRHGYRTVVVLLDVTADVVLSRLALAPGEGERRGVSAAPLAEQVATFELPAADEETFVYRPEDDPSTWIAARFS